MLKVGLAGFQQKLGVKTIIRKVQRIKDYMCVIEINCWEEKLEIMEKNKTKGFERY